MDALKAMDLDTLSDTERGQVKLWCQAALKQLGGEPAEKAKESEAKPDESNGWAQAESETETYAFVGKSDKQWPKSSGTSRRERELALRKEQTND